MTQRIPTRQALENLERLLALLGGRREIPGELRTWLLNGLRGYKDGGNLAEELGLKLKQGHRYNGASLVWRAEMERDLIEVADHIGPRDSSTADKMARALGGQAGHIPGIALDFLTRAHQVHGENIPRSKNAITVIIRGETRSARYGLTS